MLCELPAARRCQPLVSGTFRGENKDATRESERVDGFAGGGQWRERGSSQNKLDGDSMVCLQWRKEKN